MKSSRMVLGSGVHTPKRYDSLVGQLLEGDLSLEAVLQQPLVQDPLLHSFGIESATMVHKRLQDKSVAPDPRMTQLLESKQRWLKGELPHKALYEDWQSCVNAACELSPPIRDAAWITVWAGWHGDHETWDIRWAVQRLLSRIKHQDECIEIFLRLLKRTNTEDGLCLD